MEKKLKSILIDEESDQKGAKIAKYVGASYAGLGPDLRVPQKSRKINQTYFLK